MATRQIKRLLIANRGEIAVRVARACADLGITSVAVYSDADRTALHVRACDEAYYLGPPPASESYLRGDKIIEIALAAHCDAIHPGYGFLSENATFAEAVMQADLIWVGPPPEAIRLMGSKIEAKRLAQANGVPLVPGYLGDDQSLETLAAEAESIGYPLLVKASAGGGGKGMRVVEDAERFAEAVEGARREAEAAFGDGTLMLEKYLDEPRHIEVQVLGDTHGNLVHLGERECSIQRRHQKVAEESPSPVMTEELRERITSSALALARAAGYYNAGTVEFIYQDGEYYFLEMNTRLQVEHPVTEEALNFDLVQAQIRIAAGEELPITQDDVTFESHAIEVRLYSEDPERGFLPSTGTITALEAPRDEDGVRIDAGVGVGDTITPYYDPMIAKIITWDANRQAALTRMREVLSQLHIAGVTTNLDFLRWLVSHPQFEMGNLSTRFIERYYRPGAFVLAPVPVLLAAGALRLLAPGPSWPLTNGAGIWQAVPWRQARQQLSASLVIDGQPYDVHLSGVPGQPHHWQATVRQSDHILYEGTAHVVLPRQGGAGDGYWFTGVEDKLQLQLEGEQAVHAIEVRQAPEEDEGRRTEIAVLWAGREYVARPAPPLSTELLNTAVHLRDEDTLESPMPGKVLKVLAQPGQQVAEDQPLVIIEAMKMEFTVRAPHDGKVQAVHYNEGDQVAVGDVLVEMGRDE